MGADDRYIAREFQRRFFQMGLKGGSIGGAAALAVIAAFGVLAASLRTRASWVLPLSRASAAPRRSGS